MPQIFSTQIITEAGLALAAQATATNKIEYIGALSCATVPDDPTEQSEYTGRTGQIDAASATDNVARVIAAFMNALVDSPQDMKAIAVLGKLSSQSDAEAVIVAYATDANSTIVLPRSSAPEQVMRFAFNLAFNAGETVPVFQTGDATIEDLDRLVSCHKAGQPTVGADQTIYGEKTFKDTIKAAQIQSDGADAGYHLLVTGGKNNPKGVKIGWDSADNTDQVYIGGMGGGFRFRDTLMISDPVGVGALGTSQYPLGQVVANTLIASTTIGTTQNQVPQIYAQQIGSNSNKVSTIYATNYYGTFNGNLQGNLQGCIPAAENPDGRVTVTLPVGGIALACVYYDDELSLHLGEVFQVALDSDPIFQHITMLYGASWSYIANYFEPDTHIETKSGSTYFKFRLLSGLDTYDVTGTHPNYRVCMIMRIE